MSREFRIAPPLTVRFRYPAGRSWLSVGFSDTRPAAGCPWYVQCFRVPEPAGPIITLKRKRPEEGRLDGTIGCVGLVLVVSFAVSLFFPASPWVVIEGCIMGFSGSLLCLAAAIAGSGRRCGLLGVVTAAAAAGLHALFAMIV